MTKEELQKEFDVRTKIIYELYRQKITDFETVQRIVNDYYKDPAAVMKKLGIAS